MRKSFRLLAALLAFIMIAAIVPFTAFAYGASDQKLIITHINVGPSYEGAGVIASGAKFPKAGNLGTFAWWKVIIFDWDSAQGCYVVTAMDLNADNNDKSDMPIPATGFIYGLCVGNDWSASGGINYITQRMKDCYNYVNSLKIGDKAYIYDTDLAKGIIINNGKQWYDPDFTSDSYIKIGTPEEGKTAYDPTNAESVGFSATPNEINHVNYVTGASIVFSFSGATSDRRVPASYAQYQWWNVSVYDWDSEAGCFKLISINREVGATVPKVPSVPEYGFVLCDCGANTTALNNAAVGDHVWLYDIDLAAGTFGASPTIRFGSPLTDKTAYTPNIPSQRLASPVINEAVVGIMNASENGATLTWAAIPGAKGYYVDINEATICPDGMPVIEKCAYVTSNSYTIGSGIMEIGKTYTVTVCAVGNGKGTSMQTRVTVNCRSSVALGSSLNGKTIVAFGDSLTARTGYVKMLPGFIGANVINSGVGGDTTNLGRRRFERDVLDHDPDIVLICFGMNDQACLLSSMQPNVSLATYRENLEYFASTLKDRGADVIFFTPNPVNTHAGYYKGGEYGLDYGYGFLGDFCEVMRQVAVKYDCGFIDINYECSFEDLDKFINVGDGIHQSAYGHQRYAEWISDYLLARYDGIQKATMTVNCLDRNDNIIKTVTYVGKVGSHITLVRPVLSGQCMDQYDIQTTFVDGAVFNYSYAIGGNTDPDVLLGDIDGNGVIAARDYMLLKRHILGTYELDEQGLAAADIDGNGSIGSRDYMLLKRHILGTYVIGD